ncbi:MAG: pyridoxamine 5'-phosphate oxidase family protein, partial [Actinomycetales bacterium]
GTRVEAPVWFNLIDDKIVVTTPRDAWKVKRVMNNPRVEFAVCTQRGRVTGPFFTGSARVLPDSAMAPIIAAKKRRYFAFRFIKRVHRDQVAIEITPDH